MLALNSLCSSRCLDLLILLSLSPKYSDYRHKSPHLISIYTLCIELHVFTNFMFYPYLYPPPLYIPFFNQSRSFQRKFAYYQYAGMDKTLFLKEPSQQSSVATMSHSSRAHLLLYCQLRSCAHTNQAGAAPLTCVFSP